MKLGGNTSKALVLITGRGFLARISISNLLICVAKTEMEENMGIYEELQARGLLAQLTDADEIRDLINNGKATFYIGFDPTADSLHVGHFMALCLMKRLQEAGNKPIALIGGGALGAAIDGYHRVSER